MKFTIWEKKLFFDENTTHLIIDDQEIVPDIRTYEQMENLYLYKDATLRKKFWMYFMYRGVYFSPEDRAKFEKENLRYDITILVPKSIGGEPNKTFWHFHPQNKEWKYYEEIYEVLSGKALYFQQNEERAFITEADKWNKIVMKTTFWHLTINPSNTNYLVMANIVSSEFSSNYWPYREKNGGNFYYIDGVWGRNPNYETQLELEWSKEKILGENLYDDFLKNPEKYNFLK